MQLSHESRLQVLSGIGHAIRAGCLDPVLSPYFDGRVAEGDCRSPDLRAAIADLLTAVRRVGTQSRADLEQLELGRGRA